MLLLFPLPPIKIRVQKGSLSWRPSQCDHQRRTKETGITFQEAIQVTVASEVESRVIYEGLKGN